jgi:hypothetical protein
MRPPFLRASPILLSIAGALSASPALAHIDLLEPEARAHGTSANGDPDPDPNGNSNLKNAPCGQITTGRTDRVTAYAPGETIVVRVREENAHDSYLRVSIDLDGESFPLRAQAPPGPETQQQVEAAEAALGSPCLSSFRHTFAVTRMQRWYEQGLDVQALLPHLSVYLGHVHPQESYWYLTSVPELLNSAANRFETFAQTGGRRHA